MDYFKHQATNIFNQTHIKTALHTENSCRKESPLPCLIGVDLKLKSSRIQRTERFEFWLVISWVMEAWTSTMVAENSECRGVNWCSEGEEKKCEGRERKLLLLYFIKVKVNNLVWQAFIGCWMMTHRLRWPHLLAAKWLIVWVPFGAESLPRFACNCPEFRFSDFFGLAGPVFQT